MVVVWLWLNVWLAGAVCGRLLLLACLYLIPFLVFLYRFFELWYNHWLSEFSSDSSQQSLVCSVFLLYYFPLQVLDLLLEVLYGLCYLIGVLLPLHFCFHVPCDLVSSFLSVQRYVLAGGYGSCYPSFHYLVVVHHCVLWIIRKSSWLRIPPVGVLVLLRLFCSRNLLLPRPAGSPFCPPASPLSGLALLFLPLLGTLPVALVCSWLLFGLYTKSL